MLTVIMDAGQVDDEVNQLAALKAGGAKLPCCEVTVQLVLEKPIHIKHIRSAALNALKNQADQSRLAARISYG
jgi:hypothetical protein